MAAIYGLFDPRESTEWAKCRYIGQTIADPKQRLRQHVWEAQRCETERHIARWIRKLLSEGVRPQLVVREYVNDDGRFHRERHWIATGRALGWDLANSTEGGEGNSGFVPTASTREKQRQAKLGKSQSDAHRRNQSEAQRQARIVDPTIGDRQSAALKRFYSEHPEERTAISQRNLAWWEEHPEERDVVAQRMRQFFRDNPSALGQRNAKIAAAHQALDYSPVECECGAGPFMGLPGLRRHRSQMHGADKTPTICDCGAGPFKGISGLRKHASQVHPN